MKGGSCQHCQVFQNRLGHQWTTIEALYGVFYSKSGAGLEVPQILSSAESLSSGLKTNQNIGAFSEARSSQQCQPLKLDYKNKNSRCLKWTFFLQQSHFMGERAYN